MICCAIIFDVYTQRCRHMWYILDEICIQVPRMKTQYDLKPRREKEKEICQ